MQRLGLLACASIIGLVAYAPSADAQRRDRGAVMFTQPLTQPTRGVSFATSPPADGSGSLVLPLTAATDLETRGQALSEDDRGAIARALEAAEFRYGARQTVTLRGIGPWSRILIVGLGESPSLVTLHNAGAVAGRALIGDEGAVIVNAMGLTEQQAAEFATGMGVGEYRSDLYRTSEREEAPPGPTTIVTESATQAQTLYANRGRALVDAMVWVRDISNEPANVVYPQTFVERAQAALRGVQGVQVQVLDVPAMERLGMGAILGVGRGSERPPRMLIVRYRGQGAPDHGPVVLAGKGITFDSGGISIKPGENMGDMKMDMSGAASVVGAVVALARSRAPVDVVAIAALAENMPDGAAIRPGDVLTAMNGKTIEVINTDAEGRLVLADALSYAEARLSPSAVVDVATLTGAVRTALGDDYAGLFTRHDALAAQLEAAAEATGEHLWRLPLHESYAEDMRSTVADIKNTGGSAAGAGTGAHFIGEFVSREIPWAHLDIAGVAWSAAGDWKPAGSAGFGVRLLERFVRDYQAIPRRAPAD